MDFMQRECGSAEWFHILTRMQDRLLALFCRMSTDENAFQQWLTTWLGAVESGAATMSQRKLSSIQQRGDLEEARKMAIARGVHLLLLTDDQGNELVAASKHPFHVIC